MATNLEQDQIEELQKQLDEAVNRTIDKIAGVKLENTYENALAQAQNAQQGKAQQDEILISVKEIDRIFQVAQEKAEIVKAKQEAISQVEQAQKEANDAIEKSGLSPEDQQKQKDQIKTIVEQAKLTLILFNNLKQRLKTK
ncbi:hypothetical protein SDC49_01330 [Lactobacillus sp. R2/2]|nr:hypothetical protein [Lactobacillus sp. R2/2]